MRTKVGSELLATSSRGAFLHGYEGTKRHESPAGDQGNGMDPRVGSHLSRERPCCAPPRRRQRKSWQSPCAGRTPPPRRTTGRAPRGAYAQCHWVRGAVGGAVVAPWWVHGGMAQRGREERRRVGSDVAPELTWPSTSLYRPCPRTRSNRRHPLQPSECRSRERTRHCLTKAET